MSDTKAQTTALRTHEDFRQETLCIGNIIHLTSVLGSERTTDELKDLFEDFPKEILAELKIDLTPDDINGSPDEFMELLLDKKVKGFLATISTPVRTYYNVTDDAYMTSSWGWYQEEWVYGATIEEIERKAFEWVEKRAEEWKAEAQKDS